MNDDAEAILHRARIVCRDLRERRLAPLHRCIQCAGELHPDLIADGQTLCHSDECFRSYWWTLNTHGGPYAP